MLHLNQSDVNGGAALAAYRLHEELRRKEIGSRMIVGRKTGNDNDVKTGIPPTLADRAIFKLTRQVLPSNAAIPWGGKIADDPWLLDSDVVHVHNIHTGFLTSFLSLPRIARRKPLVITLHDMWHFTGHCSYSYDCGRWQSGCGQCPYPATYPAISWDSTSIEWRLKRRVHARVRAQIIAPSTWLGGLARESLMGNCDVHIIPYPLDLEQYKPVAMNEARQRLGWPTNKRIILTAAADLDEERKGFPRIRAAIENLPAALKSSTILALMGRGPAPQNLACELIALGYVSSDDKKALIYSACDYLAFASTSDNLPLVVMEALACGLPVIAFAIGGVTDMVTDGQNGWLSPADEPSRFNELLRNALSQAGESGMRVAARATAEKLFSPSVIVERHKKVYEQAIIRCSVKDISKQSTSGHLPL